MRSQEEIVARIEKLKAMDFFGFETGDLIGYLDFANAKPYLRYDAVEADWKPEPTDRDAILATMLDYMPFAWEKANGFRGISAGRSMCHYSVWTWMIGDEGVFGDLKRYDCYGKENLRKICGYYGWDADQWDDKVRANDEREV